LEAGLGFAVDLAKPDGFIGRDAVVAQKAAGPLTRRLVQVLVDDPEPLMFHAEVVHRDDRPVGYVRAASYGFTLGGAVGLVMVEAGEPVNNACVRRGLLAGRASRGLPDIRLPSRCDPCTTRTTLASRRSGWWRMFEGRFIERSTDYSRRATDALVQRPACRPAIPPAESEAATDADVIAGVRLAKQRVEVQARRRHAWAGGACATALLIDLAGLAATSPSTPTT
jgi:hypothetical protein